MRLEFNWQRRLAASLMLLAACSMPAASWGADCGVDGGAIREALLRGLDAQNNLLNQSAADVMRASRNRMVCLERFGLTQIPPLGIPGGSIVTSLANGAMERACLEYGGVDVIVSNAGLAHCAPIEALELADWERSFAVNATGHFLVTRAALRHFRRQGTGGSIVFVATKNVTAPGKDFAAYSASKAAEAQLARVAAIEGGPLGVRVNMVNPDAVFGGSHLWDGIRDQRAAAYGVAPERLEDVYRGRTLLGVEVRAEDVAEAVLFLASDRSSRTTGAMLPVDGGVREAFVR
mgnify:CR=1 FL=1